MVVEPSESHPISEPPVRTRTHCLNCGHQLLGNYCHSCGQHAREHNQGLWHFIQEFLEEFIRFDSKFLRTLVPLIVKPGVLTQQWVLGKRVRYISPLKLYISMSALCFLMVSMTAHPDMVNVGSNDQSIQETQREMQQESQKTKSVANKVVLDQVSKFMVTGNEGVAARKEFSDKFIGRLSTANLILLPIFALLFKLLYIRRSKYYVEHLVFALHYFAFICLGSTLILLLTQVLSLGNFGNLVITITAIWMFVYLPVAMIVNYQQGLIKTILKCWIFGSIYVVAIALVLFGMVIYTAYEMPDPNRVKDKVLSKAAKAIDKASNKTPLKPVGPPSTPSD